MHWQTSRYRIDLSTPRVMGIVNVTPDSFSDGGQHDSPLEALRHCEALLREGAHLLDIGGESTRPGAPAVPLAEELRRVVPVVEAAVSLGVPISVDTSKPEVMRAVLALGADIVNDVWALRLEGARHVVAMHPSCGICLMHMHREPGTMQDAPMTGDAVAEVHTFLSARADDLRAAGVAPERIVLDPGIGFGKTVEQNFSLLAQQRAAVPAAYPILAGWSRKSSLAAVAGAHGGTDRLVPSVIAALLAVQHGANLVRVHDVGATLAALAVWQAVRAATPVSAVHAPAR